MELTAAALVAALVSAVVCRSLMAAGPIDAPNAVHKKHSVPTPTGGGIGIAAGVAGAIMVLALNSSVWRDSVSPLGASLLTYVVGFSYVFLTIGFYDDARPLGPRLKLVLFVLVALLAAWAVGPAHKLPFGVAVLRFSFTTSLIFSALWVFAMVNFVNFMDGANGLAMGMMTIGMSTLAAIAAQAGSPSGTAIGLSTAGALAGFLIWNFPRGRLFAGDSGALFVGALAALTSLLLIRRIELSPFVPAIIFLPAIADASLTLIWRASRGHRLLDGHSEHLYQIAIRAGWPHWRISVLFWLITAICCATAYAASRDPTQTAPPIALAALTLAFVLVSMAVRHAALKRGIAEL
jgi:UDP-N-acetylmuramyl pentapeptide phosphotransferase/UDP-N-acetylglucosamine-1-phosphate transferase